MGHKRIVSTGVAILAAATLLPAAAWAQSASGIAGIVRDTTGAVLPGVTVEAASPALIEKIRTVVTDDQGLYRIIDLRPGTYTVTFTLPGFSTVKREGIELTASFTATVNADLRVGDLEETITVSGQSPVVDVQNVVQQRVMTTRGPRGAAEREIHPEPGRAHPRALGRWTSKPGCGRHGRRPAARRRRSMAVAAGDQHIVLRRHADQQHQCRRRRGRQCACPSSSTRPPVAGNQHGGRQSRVQSETGGVVINVIPKDGGNRLHGILPRQRHQRQHAEQQSVGRTARPRADGGHEDQEHLRSQWRASAARS